MTHTPSIQTTLRDQFHNTILPRTADQPLHAAQAQMAKAILSGLITRAHIAAQTKDVAAACAVLGTTPAILNDLTDYFNQQGKDRDLGERIIQAQATHNRTNGIVTTPHHAARAIGFGGWSC